MDNSLQQQLKTIAQRIKELRLITGKTTAEMAALAGVSEEAYIKAENGESDFSFTFVHSCAKEFGVDITDLITGEGAKLSTFSIVRRGEGLSLERRRGFKYNHLASYFKGRLSEPFMVTAKYDPEAADKPLTLSSHEGEEFDYVLKGSLRIQVAGHEAILSEGDAIYYNSSEPHGMVAYGGEDCEFLAIVTDAQGNAYEYNAKLHEEAKTSERTVCYNDFVTAVEDENGSLKSISFPNSSRFNFAFDIADKTADKEPDKLAMLHVDNQKNERRFTFGELKSLSNRAANYLESLGVKKGDRVMLVLKRHWQFWVCMLALSKIGAVVIPATNLLMKKDFVYRFNAAGVNTIICTADGDVSREALEAAGECPTLKNLLLAKGEAEGWRSFDCEFMAFSDVYERKEDSACGDDPMLMFFTSGTTGYPKIALHSHKYPLGHFITAKYWHNVQENKLHFTISDTGWGKALWGKLYGQWMCGAAVFTYDFDKFDAHDILPMFAKYGIKTFCAPPTMYRFFIKEDLSKYDLSSLEYATVAGEALNPEVYQQFYNATGIKLMEGFGQTETTLTIANLRGMTPKPGSMGKPSPAYSIAIVDHDGKEVKPGESGEIVVKTDFDESICGLYLGYYDDNAEGGIAREITDNVWYDGMYHTGDMAWCDEDGYYWYVGRIDDLIKSSGYRIGPFEIESVIMELPYVLECAVTAAPDEIRGQVVKATIVLTKGTQASDELKKEIQTYVKTHTAPYKYPRIVEFVTELPKTISGKIRRVQIRNEDKK